MRYHRNVLCYQPASKALPFRHCCCNLWPVSSNPAVAAAATGTCLRQESQAAASTKSASGHQVIPTLRGPGGRRETPSLRTTKHSVHRQLAAAGLLSGGEAAAGLAHMPGNSGTFLWEPCRRERMCLRSPSLHFAAQMSCSWLLHGWARPELRVACNSSNRNGEHCADRHACAC